MPLIKCKECDTDISDKAPACPKCGAPLEKKISTRQGCLIVILFAFGITVISTFLSDDKKTDDKNISSTNQGDVSKPCAVNDLSCRGEEGVVHASVYCQDPIERLATHSVKWTDGMIELKFSRYRWTDQPGGNITYLGDKAEFQNGFGAYTPMIYACDMGPDGKTVLDARILSEGRLPAN